MTRWAVSLVLFGGLSLSAFSAAGCGVFAQQREFDALKAKNDLLAKDLTAERQDVVTMKAELATTRERLDNALRANADTGSDLLSSKARINDLVGRTDELSHTMEQMKKDLQSTRTELDAKLDDLKRTQSVQPTPPPPPVQIPADKSAHYQAIEAAFAQKDWGLVRTLGHEYVNRYATDDRADNALFLIGDADLHDNRPTSALGEFNKLLKLFPKSDKLDRTLFDMGEAYLQLHDCVNARLAFTTCEQRFARDKIGQEAKAKVAAIDKPAPGTCAPQP
jgi:TolA-binding protein